MYTWINDNSAFSRISRHAAFWVFVVLFFTLLYGSFNEDYLRQLQIQLLFLPDKMLATYITLYVLMPHFLLREKYTAFVLWFLIILLFSAIIHWTISYYIERVYFYGNEDWGPLFYPAKVLKGVTYVYPYVVLAFSIKFLKHWYNQKQRSAHLEKGRLESELKFLRMQLHPHFLFNTLNNLYALTLKKSDQAPELVLKLSDLMDYMLYECGDNELVPLEREVEFIRNYFHIEQLRYGDRLETELEVQGAIEGKRIAPMIFLPFLENAFKHGASADLDKVWIYLSLVVDDQQLAFTVRNSKPAQMQPSNGNGHGIGLKNLIRRLELQYGEDRFDLTMTDQKDIYEVHLKLRMDGHH
ncbi:MAG: histidine kinase [Ekhidna sp.]|nr:histidine kinase [Ekhidna sp.]